MANAKVCDRCEKFFKRDHTPDLKIKLYIHCYGEREYDLCDECNNDLERFLRNWTVVEPKKEVKI